MTEIRHIVFDIGKVLIHYDPDLPFSRLIPDRGRRRWFFDNVCTSDWNIEQDRGRSWNEAEALLIERYPDEAENIRAFRTHWHEMVPHHYEDSVAIMLGLIEDGRDVTMLTNFAADTFAEAKVKFPFLDRPRDLPAPRGRLRPRARRQPIHRRQCEERAGRDRRRLAGGAVPGRGQAGSGFEAARCSLRSDQANRWEVCPVSSDVSGEDGNLQYRSVSTNEKVGQDAGSRPA